LLSAVSFFRCRERKFRGRENSRNSPQTLRSCPPPSHLLPVPLPSQPPLPFPPLTRSLGGRRGGLKTGFAPQSPHVSNRTNNRVGQRPPDVSTPAKAGKTKGHEGEVGRETSGRCVGPGLFFGGRCVAECSPLFRFFKSGETCGPCRTAKTNALRLSAGLKHSGADYKVTVSYFNCANHTSSRKFCTATVGVPPAPHSPQVRGYTAGSREEKDAGGRRWRGGSL